MSALIAHSRDFYVAVTSNMGEGLYATDPQGLVTFVNPAAEAMLGWTFDELKGRRMHDVTHHHHPDGRPFPIEACAGFRVLREGQTLRDYDDVFIRKDGSFLPVSYSSSPLRSGGEIVGLVVVFRDASERRLTEEALRANEADARLLQQLGTELMWQDDAASLYEKIVDGAAQIMRSEFASMQMFHPDRGKAGELQLLAFRGFAPDDAKRWEWVGPDAGTTCHEALKTGVRVIAADTETSPFRTAYHDTAIRAVQSTPLFSRDGTLVGMLSTHWDRPHEPALRDLRNLDILARQAADLIDQQRNRTRKDAFLATLAHELRNPLAPIRNALATLKAVGTTVQAAAHARHVIERQVDRMVRLIDDLMDANRISHGTLELRRKRFELAPLVWQAVDACLPAGENRARDITVNLPPERIFVDADPIRLYQVLCNLLSNAHKYTAAHDRISVTVECQSADLVLTVADTGIGIARDQLKTVFGMFSQLEQPATRVKEGLGIGLALVKQLVELHGGSVEARSEGLGKGSVFTIRLPVISNAPVDPQQSVPRSETTPAISRRVLVVDDNRDNAETLAALLQLHGHDVQLAYDGAEAIDVAERYRPHVVLLDIGLPRVSGYDVCRHLREQPWARQTAIVAVTGWGTEKDRDRAREAGFTAHLVKPLEYPKLVELLTTTAGEATA